MWIHGKERGRKEGKEEEEEKEEKEEKEKLGCAHTHTPREYQCFHFYHAPRLVRRSVSGAQLTVNQSSPKAVAVRQVPFTAIEQPMYAPSVTILHPIFNSTPSPFDPSQSSSAAVVVGWLRQGAANASVSSG